MGFFRPSHRNNSSSQPMKNRPTPEALAAAAAWQTQRTPIAFISGPHEADTAYFTTHYLPRIREAIDKGHLFIIGPSHGIDAMALEYIRRSGIPISRTRLYLNTSEETHLRGNFKRFEEAGGLLVMVQGGHTERDEMMTRASHYDILRYRTEKESRELYGEKYRERISRTEKNEIRRKSGVGLAFPIPTATQVESQSEKDKERL